MDDFISTEFPFFWGGFVYNILYFCRVHFLGDCSGKALGCLFVWLIQFLLNLESILDPFGVQLGSILGPLLLPFGSLLAPFGTLWRSVGSFFAAPSAFLALKSTFWRQVCSKIVF